MTRTFYLLQYVIFPLALFITLNSTLTDMTVADCNAGVELACDELQECTQNLNKDGYSVLILLTMQSVGCS